MAREYTCESCGKKGQVKTDRGPKPKRCPSCKKAGLRKPTDRGTRPAAAPKGDAGELLGLAIREAARTEVAGCIKDLVNECLLDNELERRIEAVVDARLRAAAEQIAKAAGG